MKFICKKTELSEAIINVSRVVPQKSTIPALEGIKVKVTPGYVELTAYNLEMGIRTTINADTSDSGEFVIYEMGYRPNGGGTYSLIDACSDYNQIDMLINFAFTGKMRYFTVGQPQRGAHQMDEHQ